MRSVRCVAPLLVSFVLAACESSSRLPTEATGTDAAVIPSSATSTPVLYGVNAHDDGLSVVDVVTGQVMFVGPLDPDPTTFTTPIAMAVRPSDQAIFVWNNSPKSQLLTVDPSTGLASVVNSAAPAQPFTGSLAFAPDGRLFAVDVTLAEVDPATGLVTHIGSLGSNLRAGAADFDPGGILYVVDLSSGSPDRLAVVDTGTGTATVVATLDTDTGIIGSIVFDPSGTLVASAFGGPLGNILFDLDPTNGTVTNIRATNRFAPQGMGFVLASAPVTVTIDIKPGSDPNSINCTNDKGVIPVAILTTPDFDATTVDHTTVTFEGASETHIDKKTGLQRRHEEDVDLDGEIDLVFHFRYGDTGLDCFSTEGTLSGETFDGTLIEGTDTVRMVGG